MLTTKRIAKAAAAAIDAVLVAQVAQQAPDNRAALKELLSHIAADLEAPTDPNLAGSKSTPPAVDFTNQGKADARETPVKQRPKRLKRVPFKVSRLMEFCTRRELVNQTGHDIPQWLLVILKELIDNGIDACEEAEIAPTMFVTVTKGGTIIVEDNGPGFPAKTIGSVLDYAIRVSSNEAYCSPTRGQQGNALKTILPMPYVMDDSGEDACGQTTIEAHGVAHHITFEVDHVKQEPKISHATKPSKVIKGTKITVALPRYDYGNFGNSIIERRFMALAEAYVWLNPHLTLKVKWHGKVRIHVKASNPNWKKWLPSWPTCPHWYDVSRLRRYMAAHIDNRKTITVREFISEFRGMTGSGKQKKVLAEIGAAYMRCIIFSGCIKPTRKTFGSCWPHSRSTPSRCALPISASSGKSISLLAWKRRAVIPKHFPTIDALAKPMAFRASIEFAFGIHRAGLDYRRAMSRIANSLPASIGPPASTIRSVRLEKAAMDSTRS